MLQLTLFKDVLENKTFLLTIISFSTLVKSITLIMLARQTNRATTRPRLLVMCMLICSIIIDASWIITLLNQLYIPNFDYRLRLFSLRISWGFDALLYLAISLFAGVLVQQEKRCSLHQVLLAIWYIAFFLSFIGFALFDINCPEACERSYLERLIQGAFIISTAILLPVVITFNIWKIHRISLPRILKNQVKIFVYAIMTTFWFSELFQVLPLNFVHGWDTNSYTSVTLSTIMITFAILFASRRFIGLRFLNVRRQVQSKARFNFIDGFKDVLEQLSRATTIKELQHLSQSSFKDMFRIPTSRTSLHVRDRSHPEQMQNISHVENTVENFILLQNEVLHDFITKHSIFIYDEISFSNFYEKSESSDIILKFLDAINADIFIPIYFKQKISGYIIVERFARPNELYSNVEHDEMVVYTSYLANIINLLQTRNLEAAIYREKELQEELYGKHQEINQYKESIRSFLRNQCQKEIGIIFYKNRRFTFANQAAKELIDVNLNVAQGHPITVKLKDLAKRVQEYKAPHSYFIKDKHGQKLVLSAVPHLEQNTVIITVYYPEVSDLVKKQLEALKDPTKWDYLLYLETTESGKLINQLIPSSGEQLLNFKISLLQAALNKKATLLEMPEEDLEPTAKLLHYISLRETLHIMKLTHHSDNNSIPIKLFGINPIFGVQTDEKPLFERLDNTGTLFIQNIHFLDIETQKYLADYLMYGMYRTFKSDHKQASNVRVICSTNKNLSVLVQEGKFSQELFNQIKKHTLSMPSLLTLPEDEIHQLAEGYTEQAIGADDFKNLLELTQKEKHKIAVKRPISLHELKHKIQQLLLNKSKQNNIFNETQFDPAYETTDPELAEAARLGKHALRDEKTMILLWNKFHSQSKIASFLGVNRSSVNRRCKEYDLQQ